LKYFTRSDTGMGDLAEGARALQKYPPEGRRIWDDEAAKAPADAAFDAQKFSIPSVRRNKSSRTNRWPAFSARATRPDGDVHPARTVKLSVVSETGREAVVAVLGSGDFFGEGCLAGQPIRMGTVTAMTRLPWLVLDKPR